MAALQRKLVRLANQYTNYFEIVEFFFCNFPTYMYILQFGEQYKTNPAYRIENENI